MPLACVRCLRPLVEIVAQRLHCTNDSPPFLAYARARRVHEKPTAVPQTRQAMRAVDTKARRNPACPQNSCSRATLAPQHHRGQLPRHSLAKVRPPAADLCQQALARHHLNLNRECAESCRPPLDRCQTQLEWAAAQIQGGDAYRPHDRVQRDVVRARLRPRRDVVPARRGEQSAHARQERYHRCRRCPTVAHLLARAGDWRSCFACVHHVQRVAA